VPPFTGVAVNFTVFPEQTGLKSDATVTLAGVDGLTVMVNDCGVPEQPLPLQPEIKFPNAIGEIPTGIVTITVFVKELITETLFELEFEFATYILLPSGLTETPMGFSPTGIVATTVFEVLITDTFPEFVLVTYTRLPSGLTDTPCGVIPTLIVTTEFVAVFITDTVLEPALQTYK